MHTKAPKPCALRSFFVDDSCCRSRYGVSCLIFVCVLRKYICSSECHTKPCSGTYAVRTYIVWMHSVRKYMSREHIA